MDIFVNKHFLQTLEGLTERELIEMQIPIGPRKQILRYIAESNRRLTKLPQPMEIKKKGKSFIARQEQTLLNAKLTTVNPRFLLAWADLRDHIQQWEVGYFFELLQPLVSLEVIFVLAVLAMGTVFLLGDPYNGDIRYFLSDVVSSSNVALILMLFFILVVITLLNHLYALLRPYAVQKNHEAWLEKVAMKMETEEANIAAMNARRNEPDREANPNGYDDDKMFAYFKAQSASMAKMRTVLEKMRKEMSEHRRAPKLLGVLVLNENLIQSIIAFITTAVTGFVVAFISGVMGDIQDSSGL